MTEEFSEESKKIKEFDSNKFLRILGQIITISYFVGITLVYLFLISDGTLWPTILGWLGLKVFFFAFMIETFIGSIIRTTVLIVGNYSRTKLHIVLNFISNLIIIGSTIFILLYNHEILFPFLLIFLNPLIISLPINLALLINHETFSNWVNWSTKRIILSKRDFGILQFSIILFVITFLASTVSTFFYPWFVSYYLLIPIACYYLWFIFCELIWKQITLKKIRNNEHIDL